MNSDPIEELLLRAYPNPDRKGCPGSETIRALANKEFAHGHPAWEHVWKCSPCLAEFRDLRDARLASERSTRRWRITMIAATVTIGIIGGIWIQHARRDVQSNRIQEASEIADLWSWPTSRGDEDYQRSLSWRSAVIVNLTIVLPRGADGGLYRIRVTKDRTGNNPVAATAARSSVVSQTPLKYRLRAVLDLRSAPSGTYFLQITDPSNLTYSYPLRIT